MVTFREDLPYSIAKSRGSAQDRLLMEICAQETNIEEIELDTIFDRLRDL